MNAGLALRGMIARYVREHGIDALLPHRKEAITNEHVHKILQLPNGMQIGNVTVDWTSPTFVCFRALLLTLRQAGARKADLIPPTPAEFDRSRVARANIRFQIAGIIYSSPTASELRSMTRGDLVLVRPGITKPDQLGLTFGDKDIPLPFDRSDPTNAAAAYVDLELALPVHGSERKRVAAFTSDTDLLSMSHGAADHLFSSLATAALGAAEAATISLHGGRIWKAVALRAIGCDIPTICACNRWKSHGSAEIYARMLPSEHARLIERAARVDVTKTLTAAFRGQCSLDLDATIADLRNYLDRERASEARPRAPPATPTAPTAATPDAAAAAPRDADVGDDSDEASSDDDEPAVDAGGLVDITTLAPGARVAVAFDTPHGQRYFAGTVSKVMPATARVRFPDVAGTSTTYDVRHGQLHTLADNAHTPTSLPRLTM